MLGLGVRVTMNNIVFSRFGPCTVTIVVYHWIKSTQALRVRVRRI